MSTSIPIKHFFDLLFQKHIGPAFIFILLAPTYFTYSQVSAVSEIDKNEIRIGDPIQLKLSLQIPRTQQQEKLTWPIFKDTITKQIEIIETSKIDTIKKENYNIIRQNFKVSVYDSGQFILPPIKFILNNDSTHFVQSNSLIITVHTVPTDTSDTTVKDIKPIFEEAFDIKWYMPLIIKSFIALIVLSIIIWLIYRYFKKKPTKKVSEKPKLPPHIIALEKLNNIKQEELWKEGKIKEYYSNVSDTIREYLEGRYEITALEQTSFETLQSLRFKAISISSKEKIKYILELADLVKFAKLIPIENDHHQILHNAFDFVNETKIEYASSTNDTSDIKTTQQ